MSRVIYLNLNWNSAVNGYNFVPNVKIYAAFAIISANSCSIMDSDLIVTASRI